MWIDVCILHLVHFKAFQEPEVWQSLRLFGKLAVNNFLLHRCWPGSSVFCSSVVGPKLILFTSVLKPELFFSYRSEQVSVGSQNDPDFLRDPEKMKGSVILCSCSGVNVTRLDWGWSQSHEGAKVAIPGGLTSVWLWLSVLWQLCLRHPVFSLPTLSNLATCSPWPFLSL